MHDSPIENTSPLEMDLQTHFLNTVMKPQVPFMMTD